MAKACVSYRPSPELEEQYFDDENHQIHELRKLLRGIYQIKIRDCLTLAKQSPEQVKEFTEDILGGLEIYPNAGPDGDDDDDKYMRLANRAGQVFNHEIPNRHFLLLNIPSESKDFSVMEDHHIRTLVFQSFITKHRWLNESSQERSTTSKTVYSVDDMENEIDAFLRGKHGRCLQANVIFNGHGNNRGLIVSNENEPIPTDKITSMVYNTYTKFRTSDPKTETPCKIRLIYSQCRGYLTNTSTIPRPIQVNVLTNPEHRDSRIKILKEFREPVYDVVGAFMVELNDFALTEPQIPVIQDDDRRGDKPSTQMEGHMEVE